METHNVDNVKYCPHKIVRYLPEGGTEVEYRPYNPSKSLKYYMEELGLSRVEAEKLVKKEVEEVKKDLEPLKRAEEFF